MLRFEEATEEAGKVLAKVRGETFQLIDKAHIKLLFDTKMRKHGTGLILGRICKPDDLLKFFTRREDREHIEYFDYVITLDKVAWGLAADVDKVRIVRHELRHVFHDADATDPWKLWPHDVEDFRIELRENEDDPDWGVNLMVKTRAAYAGVAPQQGTIPGAPPPEKKKPKLVYKHKAKEKEAAL